MTIETPLTRTAAAQDARAYGRATLIAGGIIAAFAAGALYLWARHGSAVFHEIIVAGLALCF